MVSRTVPADSEATVGAQRAGNVHVHEGVGEDEFVAMRDARDATLSMPKLILALAFFLLPM